MAEWGGWLVPAAAPAGQLSATLLRWRRKTISACDWGAVDERKVTIDPTSATTTTWRTTGVSGGGHKLEQEPAEEEEANQQRCGGGDGNDTTAGIG